MPKIDLMDTGGKKAGEVDLPKEIFAAKINEPLMAQAVRVYLSNQRKARAKARTRGEVDGSGRKIYRQKGTGRARHGDRQAPIFVGGGKAHGPTGGQNYRLKMSKKMRRLALFSALTSKFKEKEILVVGGLEKIEPKTKVMVKILKNLNLREKLKILLILPENLDGLFRATRNIKGASLIQANLLNTYAVLNGGKLILMKESIEKIKKTYYIGCKPNPAVREQLRRRRPDEAGVAQPRKTETLRGSTELTVEVLRPRGGRHLASP